MDTNKQKLIAAYLSNIFGIIILFFFLISLTNIKYFYTTLHEVTFSLFIVCALNYGLTFYVAFSGYKHLESPSLKKNALFIAIINFLFLILFVSDSWLTNIFGNYFLNVFILIPYMIVGLIFGVALLRNGNAILNISKIPPTKKIRNISLLLFLIGIIFIVLSLIIVIVDMISNPNIDSYLENRGDYEFTFISLKYAIFSLIFLAVISFGIGLLGIIYWIYLKFKNR